ncbi:hypothetical protein PoMZ_02607 [Pyricularia oryzae]|uniref:Uncharacterized protein n=1 Tax=Pyricularia oryzae TaxID=318829 RepID=A0A4P7N5Q2_PYROR|nr:hypothetical protein PoMZ_02607 [Pyricularia oryzae]
MEGFEKTAGEQFLHLAENPGRLCRGAADHDDGRALLPGGEEQRLVQARHLVVDGVGLEHGRGEYLALGILVPAGHPREARLFQDGVPPVHRHKGLEHAVVVDAGPPVRKEAEHEADAQSARAGELDDDDLAPRPEERPHVGHGLLQVRRRVQDVGGDDEVVRVRGVALLLGAAPDVQDPKVHPVVGLGKGLVALFEEARRDVGERVAVEGRRRILPEDVSRRPASARADLQDVHVLVPVHDGREYVLHVVVRRSESGRAPVELGQQPVVVHELERVPAMEKDVLEALADPLHKAYVGVGIVLVEQALDVGLLVRLPFGLVERALAMLDLVHFALEPPDLPLVVRCEVGQLFGSSAGQKGPHVEIHHALHGRGHFPVGVGCGTLGLVEDPFRHGPVPGPLHKHGVVAGLGRGRGRLDSEVLNVENDLPGLGMENLHVAADGADLARGAGRVVVHLAAGPRHLAAEPGVQRDAADGRRHEQRPHQPVAGGRHGRYQRLQGVVQGDGVEEEPVVGRGSWGGEPHGAAGFEVGPLDGGDAAEVIGVAVAHGRELLVKGLDADAAHVRGLVLCRRQGVAGAWAVGDDDPPAGRRRHCVLARETAVYAKRGGGVLGARESRVYLEGQVQLDEAVLVFKRHGFGYLNTSGIVCAATARRTGSTERLFVSVHARSCTRTPDADLRYCSRSCMVAFRESSEFADMGMGHIGTAEERCGVCFRPAPWLG